MIVGNFSKCWPIPFLEGYVPVRMEAKTGSVQPDGDMAVSNETEDVANSSM